MGVHGLWRLIEPSGKPVPLETLENKILAVDVSIWLHQAIKGFQDSKGAPVPNAHLLGIYHRVCKLLYFKIKPVFIFDGGVPVLKKQTIAKRNQQKSRTLSDAEKLQNQLINTLLKHSAISKVLSEKTKASLTLPPRKTDKHDNMYALPPSELDSTISSSEEEEEGTTESTDSSPTKHWDVYTIDMTNAHFKSLPVDVRHEILTELKETRKQSSWGRLHELPKQSDGFSSYQVNRLLKRQAVQSALEDAEKEMGGHSLSLGELESILKDYGVVTTHNMGKRIASDENTRYLYIKDVKQALEKARKDQSKLDSIQEEESSETNKEEIDTESETKSRTRADLEFENELETAIALSLQEAPSTSKVTAPSNPPSKNKLQFSFLENFNDADFESDASDDVEVIPVKKFSSAQSYMMEYSGLTPNEINKILSNEKSLTSKNFKGKNIIEKRSKNNDTKANDIADKPQQSVSSTDQTDAKNGDKVSCDLLENAAADDEDNNLDKKSYESNQHQIVETTTNISPNSAINITKAAAESTEIDTETKSDTSSDDEFEEVTEEMILEDKSSLEIVIDPKHKLEDDDLFSDIFNDHNDEVKTDNLDSAILPETNLKAEKKIEQNEAEIRIVNNENLSETEVTLQEASDRKSSLTEECKVSSTNEEISENRLEPQNDAGNKNLKNGTPQLFQEKIDPKIQKVQLEQMTKMRDDLQKEKIDILVEKSVKERMAGNITDQMYQEAQDLLELFGVPYIVAPMEAEAQCAFLDAIDLTDGTITDDSDIWLFGGRTVYKNFFNQSKYVMEFKVENIKHHFKLTREQMILLALLVGSDYTVGLQGVGPVTALEILAAFPPAESKEFSLSHADLLSGLKEFRSWFNKGKSSGLGRTALKNKLKNVAFTDNFPSSQVVQAYMEPTVETSKEKFTWSKPDFVGLTELAKEKFGWSSRKTEEILKPVIKRVEESQAQKTIKDYFKTVFKADSTDAQQKMSKRVKSAINRIGKTPEELIAEEMEALSKEKQKKTRSKRTNNKSDHSTAVDTGDQPEIKTKKPRKKKLTAAASNSTASEEIEEPKAKQNRNKKIRRCNSKTVADNTVVNTDEVQTVTEDPEDIKNYENIALELKERRQRRNALPKKDEGVKKKKPTMKTPPIEVIPEVLEDDEEIQLLKITTSRSVKRAEEIEEETKNELAQQTKKLCLPNLHKQEVIHQKLRDKSNSLRNKMKAIEVFRKSKKGPGYIPKRDKKRKLLKEEAELSENSSDD